MNLARTIAGAMLLMSLGPMMVSAAEDPPPPPGAMMGPAPYHIPLPPHGLFMADRDHAPPGAWLGVQLAPVPAALASHLKLGPAGVMVRNVFKDSPADKAGLDRYDVIVAVDGKELSHGMETFPELIRTRKADDQLKLTLYQLGEKKELPIALAETPEHPDELAMRYEDDPDIARRKLFEMRGKILRPGPDGWILDDLGEMPPFPQFEHFREGRGAGRRPLPEPPEIQEGHRVNRDGQVLQVRREKDGTIIVKRYKTGTPPDQITPKKYASVDELRKADPEAAQLLSSAASRPADGQGPPRPKNWDRLKRAPQDDGNDDFRRYQDALREYMQKFPGKWERPAPPPQSPKWKEWGEKFFPEAPGQPAPPRPAAPPPHRPERQSLPEAKFNVHADGSIEAHVQNGPTELNMTFPNEQAMQQQAPQLYERYKDARRSLR